MGWYYVITKEIRECFEGKDADVFAVINGYSQDGQGCFYGSLASLSEFCGIKSKTTTQKILKGLVERGVIVKEDEIHNGVKFCKYTAHPNWYGISKNGMGGISETDTNNEDININTERDIKRDSHRFVKPTLEEVEDYCRERGNNVNPEEFFAFYESKGWVVGKSPMKNWKACVRTWELTKKDRSGSQQRPRKESVFEHNLREMDKMFGTNMHEQAYGRKEV